MPLATEEAFMSGAELLAFAMKVGKTMKSVPPEKTDIQEAAIVIRAHAAEAADLMEAIEARVKS